jgi:hypothetical protein
VHGFVTLDSTGSCCPFTSIVPHIYMYMNMLPLVEHYTLQIEFVLDTK